MKEFCFLKTQMIISNSFLQTKASAWEGGQRNLAVVWSPLIKKTQRISNDLMHLSDWLPTIYSAAGVLFLHLR